MSRAGHRQGTWNRDVWVPLPRASQSQLAATRKGEWLFLKQHMVALAACEMLRRLKYSWGVTNHTPLLFIIALDTVSAGPLTSVRTGDSSHLASQCLPSTESQSKSASWEGLSVTGWLISHICQKASLVLSSFFAYLVCQFDVWSQAAAIWDVKSTQFHLPSEPSSVVGNGCFFHFFFF